MLPILGRRYLAALYHKDAGFKFYSGRIGVPSDDPSFAVEGFRETANLKGVVVNERDDRPVPRFPLALVCEVFGSQPVLRFSTDADGYFAIRGVPAGPPADWKEAFPEGIRYGITLDDRQRAPIRVPHRSQLRRMMGLTIHPGILLDIRVDPNEKEVDE